MPNFLSDFMLPSPMAVALATLAMLIVRGLWASRFLFGRAQIRLSGIRPGDIHPRETRRNTAIMLLTTAASSYLVGLLYMSNFYYSPQCINAPCPTLYQQSPAAFSHFLICIGFVWFFSMLEQVNSCLARREPFALFLLQTLRQLASLMAAGAVFYLFGVSHG